MKKITDFLKQHWVIILILVIAAVAHAYNMFHFPYYENDEGTYMSQAWAILTHGTLAPYTYWYDHAPGGWIFIAVWVKLTGGFFTFGPSINSGRVFMLVLHLFSTFFLYEIVRKISGRKWPAALACLMFSLSPLAIYFQRRVLLDNIMTFWVFLSLWILVRRKIRLRDVILSALAFGIGVLSKENAVFFIPVFVYFIWEYTEPSIRRFAVINWIMISGLVISFYFLYALLNSEFFPVGFLGNFTPRVSLLASLADQASRGTNLPFWKAGSDFYMTFFEWIHRDPLTIIAGIGATVISGVLAYWKKSLRLPFLLALMFWLFLIRGKLVIDFYIIPLIPVLAACVALVIDWLVEVVIPSKVLLKNLVFIILLAGILVAYRQEDFGQYSRDETHNQIDSINWIKANVAPTSEIVIDNYAYIDFRSSRFPGDPVFPNSDWFWKLSYDPAITTTKLKGRWQNLDYIALSHEMLKQISLGTQPMLKSAFVNSDIVKDWFTDTIAFRDFSKFISTNGDWMSLFKLKSSTAITLTNAWNYYKAHFIHSYGQVIDPSTNSTTSEAQSYALLRAVWANDKTTFDGVLSWTHDHMQYRTGDKLFSWDWQDDGTGTGTFVQKSSETAADADVDIATALVLASEKFQNPDYLNQAKSIITSIWNQEVVNVAGRYYLASNTSSLRPDGYLINPSYFSPASYKIFAQVDPNHPWSSLVTDSYYLLNNILAGRKLPPNWIILDKNTGEIKSASAYVTPDADNYGFDAFRVVWRVGLDAQLFKSQDAQNYLNRLSPFYTSEWQAQKSFAGIYTTNGTRTVDYDSISTDTAPAMALSASNSDLSNQIFSQLIDNKFNLETGAWGDPNNYYDQNWAWFATIFVNGAIPASKYFTP